jgi:hypothetical protein
MACSFFSNGQQSLQIGLVEIEGILEKVPSGLLANEGDLLPIPQSPWASPSATGSTRKALNKTAEISFLKTLLFTG